ALYRIEKADQLLQIDAAANSSHQHLTEAEGAGPDGRTANHYQANLASTAFELDLFGRVHNESEAALETFFATEAARDAAQVTLIAETVNAYLQWLVDRETLDLLQRSLASREKSLELVTARQEIGLSSKLDLASAQAAVESVKVSRAIYSRFVEEDRNALALLIGKHDESLLPAEASLENTTILEDLPIALPSNVLLKRPDVREAEHQLKSANANIGAARAAFFPRITLTGSVGFASNDLGDLFTTEAAGAWSFIPQISIPIFDNGRNAANLDYSEVRKNIAVARYEKAIQNGFREVNNSLAARRLIREQLDAQRRLASAREEAYTLAHARYEAGLDSLLESLIAQDDMLAAQQAEIDALRQELSNTVTLYKVLGGGVLR
ncbi:MAG: efflux transporter outer membrane subunit, partial [Planctomycetes bacterium]|nr:efflux transporter outer membrane subunit [Planctomycetota bacterium]